MSKCMSFVVGLWMATASVVSAQDNPVVVELFTSQGCSSCPPADKILHDLAERDDVIALALHVDYWDYIGWKDIFANPAYTKRQNSYAHAWGERSVYTPQTVIAGADHVVGSKAVQIMDMINRFKAQDTGVSVDVTRSNNTISIAATADKRQKMDVHVVRYSPMNEVSIRRGENAGRTLNYANVVTAWDTVKQWDGRSDLALKATVTGDDPIVVIIQSDKSGPILASARLR